MNNRNAKEKFEIVESKNETVSEEFNVSASKCFSSNLRDENMLTLIFTTI